MTRSDAVRTMLIAALSLMAASAPADIVELKDGSRLLGTVERWGDGKLILATQFAGTLEIDAALVVTIQTDQPVNVGIDTGDRLVGPVEWKPAIDRAVVQTELGGIPVSVERILAIWPKDGKSPEALALEEQIAKVKQEAEAQRARWGLTLEMGLFYTEGNKEIFTARGRVELRRKDPRDLLKFYISGDYGEDRDERNTAEAKGGAYYEHLLSERWFAFGKFDLEYDEFENLELRVSTGAGLGYYWLKEETHELKTRGGFGYLHETFLDGLTNNAAQAELGLEYRLDITSWMRFTHATTYYPTFESVRDYRLVSDSGLIFPLGESEVWKLKLGAQYEYKSIPSPGTKSLDQTYYANILLDLE
jgi:putative salt-induced outer membrane protein YdiY